MLFKKSIFLLVVFCFLLKCPFVTAQRIAVDSAFLRSVLMSGSYVFEGTVVKYFNIFDGVNYEGRCYIKVHKVFKGNITTPYVEIQTEPIPGTVIKGDNNITHTIGPATDVYYQYVGENAVFVMSEYPVELKKLYKADSTFPLLLNQLVLSYNREVKCFTGRFDNVINIACRNCPPYYRSVHALYNYLDSLPGFKRKDMDSFKAYTCLDYSCGNIWSEPWHYNEKIDDTSRMKALMNFLNRYDLAWEIDSDFISQNSRLLRGHIFQEVFGEPFMFSISALSRRQASFSAYRYLFEIKDMYSYNDECLIALHDDMAQIALNEPAKFVAFIDAGTDERKRKEAITIANWQSLNADLQKHFLQTVRKSKYYKEIKAIVLAQSSGHTTGTSDLF